MCHEREDKFAHAARGRDWGLAEVYTSAFGVNTSFDRKAVRGMGDAWAYKYQSCDQDGAKKPSKTETRKQQLVLFKRSGDEHHGGGSKTSITLTRFKFPTWSNRGGVDTTLATSTASCDLRRLLFPGREKKVQDRPYGIRSLKRWVGFWEWKSVSGITDARTPWLAFSSRWRYARGVLRRPGDQILQYDDVS